MKKHKIGYRNSPKLKAQFRRFAHPFLLCNKNRYYESDWFTFSTKLSIASLMEGLKLMIVEKHEFEFQVKPKLIAEPRVSSISIHRCKTQKWSSSSWANHQIHKNFNWNNDKSIEVCEKWGGWVSLPREVRKITGSLNLRIEGAIQGSDSFFSPPRKTKKFRALDWNGIR